MGWCPYGRKRKACLLQANRLFRTCAPVPGQTGIGGKVPHSSYSKESGSFCFRAYTLLRDCELLGVSRSISYSTPTM